ncbi:MAG: hypothetical protein IKQ80_11855 [Clostridia bacterium]|nr:hypothetical protein [Clostridia bacterium]
MLNDLMQRLRGARRVEILIALVLAAIMGLMLINGRGADREDGRTDLEARLERILARIDGVGGVSAMVAQGEDGAVTGVLIVADRVDDVGTYLRLQRAVLSVVDTQAERVEIIGRHGCFGGGQ